MVPGSGTRAVDLKPGAPKAEAAPPLKLTVEPAPISREARVWLTVPKARWPPLVALATAEPLPSWPSIKVVPPPAVRPPRAVKSAAGSRVKVPAPVLVRVPTPEITPVRVALNPLVLKFPPGAKTLMRRSELKSAVVSRVPPLNLRMS